MKKSEYKGHFGVDIGGTTITSGLFQSGSSEPIEIDTDRRAEFSTPAKWLEQGAPSRWDTRNLPWVLGIPGTIRNQKEIGKTPNLSGAWEGSRLTSALEEKGLAFTLENDANLAALGESEYGAGKDVDHLILLTLGTGIGGGIIINKNLYRGSSGLASEIGHVVLEPGGRVCGCGDVGCFEQYGSATGLQKTYEKLGGELRDAHEIVQRAGKDVLAEEAVRQTGWALGRGIAKLVNLLEPELILFSGGLSRSLDLLRPAIREAFNDHLFVEEARGIPLHRTSGDHSALMGTLRFLLDHSFL